MPTSWSAEPTRFYRRGPKRKLISLPTIRSAWILRRNAATGETVDAVSETGVQSNLFDLVAHAGQRVRQDLELEVIAPTDAEQARSSVSTNTQALRLYVQGVQKLQNFDPLGARDLLQKAVAADPDYALAQSALAEAWMMLGYDQLARAIGADRFSSCRQAGTGAEAAHRGRDREAAHQWPQAITAYRTLFNAHPDNLEYGLRLTRAQRLAAQYRDVLETIQSLRALPSPASNDPRIDLEETMAAVSSGDFAAAAAVYCRDEGPRARFGFADCPGQAGSACLRPSEVCGRPARRAPDLPEPRQHRLRWAGLAAYRPIAESQGRFPGCDRASARHLPSGRR